MIIIIEGTCKVYQKDKRGHNIFMRKLNTGDLFGLSAFSLVHLIESLWYL